MFTEVWTEGFETFPENTEKLMFLNSSTQFSLRGWDEEIFIDTVYNQLVSDLSFHVLKKYIIFLCKYRRILIDL